MKQVNNFRQAWEEIMFHDCDIVMFPSHYIFNVDEFNIQIEKEYYILKKQYIIGEDILDSISMISDYDCEYNILFNQKEYSIDNFTYIPLCTPYIPMYFIVKCKILPDNIHIHYNSYLLSTNIRKHLCSTKVETNTNIYEKGKIINKV
jgi:hypothetical protein